MSLSGPARFIIALALAAGLAVGIVAPGPVAADVATVLLEVPWRTQIDGSPDQRHNAGLVGLGMVLSAYGQGVPTATLRREHDLLAGMAHAPVTLTSLSILAAYHGLVPQTLEVTPDRSTAELRRQLGQGRPVLMWLGADDPAAGERWVVAVGHLTKGDIVCNDPGEPLPVYGQLRLLKRSEEQRWLQQGAVGLALGMGAQPPEDEPTEAAGQAAPPLRGAVESSGMALLPERSSSAVDNSPYWWRLIETYASWFGLDPYYVAAVVLAESAGNPGAVGDQGHSIGLMQLHDAGFGAGLFDARYDPALNLWHGTKALASGMARYGDPYETYARYYNPGGEVAGERVMAWYRWLRELGEKSQRQAGQQAMGQDGVEPSTISTPGGPR